MIFSKTDYIVHLMTIPKCMNDLPILCISRFIMSPTQLKLIHVFMLNPLVLGRKHKLPKYHIQVPHFDIICTTFDYFS